MEENVLNQPEKIILTIMESTGKSEEDVKELIQKKIKDFDGLLNEGSAAFSVAKDLKVEVDGAQKPEAKTINISELKEGVEGVNVLCRVKQVFAPKTFERKGKTGKVCGLIVADETAEARLSLWHKDVALVENEEVKVGTALLLKDVSVSTWNDQLQLSVNFNGEVLPNPQTDTSKLPEFKVKTKKVKEVTPEDSMVNVVGKVARTFPVRTFQQATGTGKVGNIVLKDETGEIRVALWGDHADALENLRTGDVILASNAYAKKGFQDQTELNVSGQGLVIINPSVDEDVSKRLNTVEVETMQRKTIEDLEEGDTVEVMGTISDVLSVKTFDSDGTQKLLVNFNLDDGTGLINCAAFGEQAEQLTNVTPSDVVKKPERSLENAREACGKDYVVYGKAKIDSYSERLRFTVINSTKPDYKKETKQLLVKN